MLRMETKQLIKVIILSMALNISSIVNTITTQLVRTNVIWLTYDRVNFI